MSEEHPRLCTSPLTASAVWGVVPPDVVQPRAVLAKETRS